MWEAKPEMMSGVLKVRVSGVVVSLPANWAAKRRGCLPGEAGVWAAFLVAVVLAMVVSYAIRFLVALSGFWLLDGTGALQVLMVTGVFCSGMALPLNAFPQPLGDVVMLLPWSALLQTPADVLMGRVEVWSAFAFQAGWAVVLLAVGRLVQGAATRRVVVQGG